MTRNSNKPGPGHNIVLDEEEIAAPEAHFSQKIRESMREVDVAAAALKAKREVVNSHFAGVKQHLKTSRKDFEDLLAKQAMSPAEFAGYWAKITARYARHGLPVGVRQDLFVGPMDTADDQAAAHAAGLRAGRNGDDPSPPSLVAAVLHQDWLSGWHEGQKELFMQLEKADGVFAKLKQAGGELTEDEGDEEIEDDTDLDAEARKLKKSGWAEPAPDETAFETEG